MIRTRLISILIFTGALILTGMGWLSFGYHLPLDGNPWSVFAAVLVLTTTGLGVIALRRLARRRGFPRLGLILAVLAVFAVLWALPSLVSPCSPIVAAVSAGSAQCSQCCTWWEAAPSSLCSAADKAAGRCKGCCYAYEPCNCVTQEPDPDTPTPVPPTKTPTSTPTRTPTSTPTFTPTPTNTSTPTNTATPTDTPTPTPTPLPPVISGTLSCSRWGENGWCIEGARLTLNASDPQGFSLSISGNIGSVPISCGAACIVDLPEGNGNAVFTVTSASGRTASGSQAWKYDASLPAAEVQLTGTTGANGWYVSTVSVDGIGVDSVSGVDTVEVSVNGGAWQPTATLDDGVYQVQARVADQAGWGALSAVQTVRVDASKPNLSMTPSGTKGGGDYFRSAVTVSLAADDAGSGIALVEYRLDGQGWTQGDSVTITTDGDHGLEGRVTDNAGNVALRGIAIHIDTIPPVATFIMPSPDSTTPIQGDVMLGGKVFDVGSGVAGVEISLESAPQGYGGKTWQVLPLVNEIWRYGWYTTQLPNGSYPVIARARDIAGNVQAPGTSVIIIAANHPPFVDVQARRNIWESGALSVRENGGIPVDSIRVIIRDPQGRWSEVVQEYSARNLPKSITWNRRFADGTLAPSGDYEVIVEARDIYGNEASDQGVITIPSVATATMTSTPTITPSPSPTATKIASPLGTAVPTEKIKPTQAIFATTVPTVQPTLPAVAEQPGKPFSFWPVVGLVGLLMALASAAIADARPRALARMKETFNQIMKNQGE